MRLSNLIYVPLIMAVSAACDIIPDNNQLPVELKPRTRTSAQLSNYQSCFDLENDLKNHLREEMRVKLLMDRDNWLNYSWGYGGGMIDETTAMAESGSDSGGTRQEGVDFSGTNNQESGVDEADIVKTDGYFIYAINGTNLEILGVPQFGELNHTSTVAIEGYPRQLLLSGDRAVVFSSVYSWNMDQNHPLHPLVNEEVEGYDWYRGSTLTKITVIDLDSARTNPQISRELFIEGWQMTGREIEGVARTVSYSYFDLSGMKYYLEIPNGFWELPELHPARTQMIDQALIDAVAHNDAVITAANLSDFLPNIYEVQNNVAVVHPFGNGTCDNFSVSQDGFSRGFTSIVSLDLEADAVSFEADHVMSNWPTVYASTDTLLISELSHDWWWFWNNADFEEATNIHRFDISENGTTEYTGSGRVPGHILNQFSLSEYQGDIRVATTVGSWMRWWVEDPSPIQNFVHVLAGENELTSIGVAGPIALNERIWSARFVEDRAYIVTFQNIDPLWTIDLSDRHAPRIMGELEIPGVSTYIHPLSDDTLLTIGLAGDQDGLFWGQTALNTFDVSDFSNPTRSSLLELSPVSNVNDGWEWGWSEATYEHKAFQYWGPQSLLAIPLSTYRWLETQEGDYGYEYVSKLELVNVVEGEPLTRYGSIDHSDFYNTNTDDWWSYRDIRRSIFMGDYVYAISDKGVTCHQLSSLEKTAEVQLEGTSGYWY